MNSSYPLFSILIANYNNVQYIQETLECIYNQTYPNWEIIIVDDKSTDNSEYLYENLANNSKIRIVRNENNRGTGYTKRRCVEEARGEICAFLDPDDTITPQAIELMVNKHQEDKEASLVYSKYIICDQNLEPQDKSLHQKQCNQNDLYYLNLDHSIGHFASFKKQHYNLTEGISPYLKRAVDQDLYLKLYEVGNVIFLNEYLYHYRIHEGGISTLGNVEKANYWHWMVMMDASKRRGIELENLFVKEFVRRDVLDKLDQQYQRLKKYEKINNLLKTIRQKLRF